jgi:hypothetical protein
MIDILPQSHKGTKREEREDGGNKTVFVCGESIAKDV